MRFIAGIAGALCLGLAAASAASAPKPHILFVLVDDFGWGDTGYHRAQASPEVVTPTLDALVKDGLLLDRQYVHPMCTPTRSSLQTGRLPVHVQLKLANPCNPHAGIPRNMTGIAQKMKMAGYATHLVGKWDAGMASPTHTPQGRGYDTSLNYYSHGNWAWSEAEWGGSEDGSLKMPTCEPPKCFKDLWDTDRPASGMNGTLHEEYLFRQRFTHIIAEHDPATPLFLVYTPKIAHYPLQAPLEYQRKFGFIKDSDNRRMYAAMVNFLDDQVANITGQLKARGMWGDTLMVLSTDNGGYVKAYSGGCQPNTPHGYACFNGEAGANNYPLRGGKYTSYEGGIRGNAFVSGGFLPASVRGTTQSGMMHVADWYGTFCGLAGVDPADPVAARWGLPPVDSVDVWPLLSGTNTTSPRTDILVNAQALVSGRYKLLTGVQKGASWGGPQYPNASTETAPIYPVAQHCNPACLYDVVADPTEHTDIAAANPHIVAAMQAKLAAQSATIWQQPSVKDDPACAEAAMKRYGGFIGPWMELPHQS